MKISQVEEGGWTDTITQQTKLIPAVVKSALVEVQSFTNEFNSFLKTKDIPPVEMGAPTGSSAYHNVDEPDKEYGDIDLQMIAPDIEGKNTNQLAGIYNKLVDEFIQTTKPHNVYDQNKPAGGHVIFKLKSGEHIQVDLLWTPSSTSEWSRWRVTPQRGVKGLIYGNMYSSLGEIMRMSIQTSGAQMKTVDKIPVQFSKRKGTELLTVSTDIRNFGIDILNHICLGAYGQNYKVKISPELKSYPGLKTDNVQISDLVHTVKGLASSFELNDVYDKYNLEGYANKDEFLKAFNTQFTKKANEAINAPKFNKAETPQELAQVKHVRDQIKKGLDLVHNALAESINRKLTMNKRLGKYTKGTQVVGLWESKGRLLVVDHKTKTVKETAMSKPALRRMFDKKGWKLVEAVDMISLKNQAGAILNVFADKIKGTTTIRDQNGGQHEYNASLGKVLGSLQKKGYKKNDPSADDFGGLSLEPMEPTGREAKMGMSGMLESEWDDDDRRDDEETDGGRFGGKASLKWGLEDDPMDDEDDEELMASAKRHPHRYGFQKKKLKIPDPIIDEGVDRFAYDIRDNHPAIAEFMDNIVGYMAFDEQSEVTSFDSGSDHIVIIKIQPATSLENTRLALEYENIMFIDNETDLKGRFKGMDFHITAGGKPGNRMQTFKFTL